MSIERWGAFSVIDHRHDQQLATEVLLYDRLLIPTPMDWDLDRWDAEGWDPDPPTTDRDPRELLGDTKEAPRRHRRVGKRTRYGSACVRRNRREVRRSVVKQIGCFGIERIILAVAEGELTPAQGAAVAGLVETFRRTLETEELELRVERLEQRNGQ